MLAAVSLVTSPTPDGAYNADDTVLIRVEFDAPVTITSGTPILRLNSSPSSYATFTGVSGAGATLNFAYRVAQGENIAELDVSGPAALTNATFSWSGGTFIPVLPNGVNDSRSLARMKDIEIDTMPPARPLVNELRINPTIDQTNTGYFAANPDYFTLTGRAGTGPLGPGESLTVTVNGNTYVLTAGSQGAPDSTGAWRVDLRQPPTSGVPLNPWSTTNDARYRATATLTDAAGNTSTGLNDVVIDTVGPTIQNVTSLLADGSYGVGTVIEVQVVFNEPIFATTSPQPFTRPQLRLQFDPPAGSTAPVFRWADYVGQAGLDSTVLVFRYTVAPGDNTADLDYALITGTTPPTAIILNGESIQDSAANPADLTMKAAGAEGSLGANKDIRIDTTAPAPLVITQVNDDVLAITGQVTSGGVTNDTNLTVRVTFGVTAPTGAVAGDVVQLFINGSTPLGAAYTLLPSDISNLYADVPTGTLTNGVTYVITATLTDDAGNISAPSNSWTVTVDTDPPAAPVITSVVDNFLAQTGTIAPGGVTNDPTPTINGTTDADSTVEVFYNGTTSAGPATVVGTTWSLTTNSLLTGSYTFTARATDRAGNVGPMSASYTVTIDAMPPTVAISRTGSGTLKSGDTVLITFTLSEPSTDFGGAGDVTCPDGLISGFTGSGTSYTATFTPAPGFEGTATVSVAAGTFTDAVGNANTAASSLSIPVDTKAPNAPVITGIDDDKDAAGNTVTPTNVPNGGRTNDTVLVIKGTTEAGSTVEVFDNATSLGFAVVTGTTWTFTTGTLSDGTTYSFTAKTTDAAGNTSTSSVPPYVVTVDTDVPDPPAILGFFDDAGSVTGQVNSGGISNDTTPLLSGTMEAGTTNVEVFEGTLKLTGTLLLTSATTWSFSVAASQLADGPRSLTAFAIDGANNRSTASLPYTVWIDTVAVTPSITGVYDDVAPLTGNVPNGGSTNDTVLLITGTAEAGSTVELYNDVGTSPVLLGNPMLVGTGWTFTTGVLSPSTYNFRVKITDPAGNVSALSSAYTVTVDVAAPARPTITGIVSDAPSNPGTVPNGGTTNDTSLVINGTAEKGATVLVYNYASLYGQATADAVTGLWSLPTGVLVGGTTYSFTATATDAAGNVGEASLPAYTVTIDLTIPAVPTIDGVADDKDAAGNTVVPTNVPNGGRTNDTVLVLTGTTAPGTRIDLFNGGLPVPGQVTYTNGRWTFQTGVLVQDSYAFQARAMTAAGNTSYSATYSVTVDTTAPAAPSITSVTDDVGTITGNVANNGFTNDTNLMVRVSLPNTAPTGAIAGDTVQLFNGLDPLGTAYTLLPSDILTGYADVPTGTLVDGLTYAITARITDGAGYVGPASASRTVTIDATAPTVFISPAGSGTLKIGDTVLITFTLSKPSTDFGTGDATAINGSLSAISQVSSTIYTATFTPASGFEGNATVSVAAGTFTDAVGNVNTAAASLAIPVDTKAPAAPVITGVEDDKDGAGNTVTPTNVPNGGRTNDAVLVIKGTTEAGSTVEVFDNGTSLGFAVVIGTNWTFTTGTLVEGSHSFTATATDAAGNTGMTTVPPYVVTVDTTPPAPPVINEVIDNVGGVQGVVVSGKGTDDTTPELKGFMSSDTTRVAIYRNGVWVGDADLLPDSGTWSYPISIVLPLARGLHSFTACAFDSVGNKSGESSPYTLTVVETIRATSPTFPANSIRAVATPITTFSVVFNQPVSGFTVNNLKLFLGGRPVGLKGAAVRLAAGSDGTTWIVSLPKASINLKGNYRLDIVGASIRSLLSSESMVTPSSLFWRRV